MESNKTRPLIFISNDDGYNFAGIKTLINVALEFGDVVVAAPLNHQSGKASAITILNPLRAFVVESNEHLTVYAVDGTPADCAKLGLGALVKDRKVDLVLAGINHGFNQGSSVLYSGTMGIAFEGTLSGIPTVAFSYEEFSPKASFSRCEPVVREIIEKVLAKGLPQGVCLNVNIPAGEAPLQGIKVTTSSPGLWTNTWDHRTDPRGMDYYWMLGSYKEENPDDDNTDLYWLKRGWVSVTPTQVDQTAHQAIPEIKNLLF